MDSRPPRMLHIAIACFSMTWSSPGVAATSPTQGRNLRDVSETGMNWGQGAGRVRGVIRLESYEVLTSGHTPPDWSRPAPSGDLGLNLALTDRLSLFEPGLVNYAVVKGPETEVLLFPLYGAAFWFNDGKPDGFYLETGPGIRASFLTGHLEWVPAIAFSKSFGPRQPHSHSMSIEAASRWHIRSGLRISATAGVHQDWDVNGDIKRVLSFGAPLQGSFTKLPLVEFDLNSVFAGFMTCEYTVDLKGPESMSVGVGLAAYWK